MNNMSWYYEKFNGYEKEMAEIRLDADGMWWYSEGYDDGSHTRWSCWHNIDIPGGMHDYLIEEGFKLVGAEAV